MKERRFLRLYKLDSKDKKKMTCDFGKHSMFDKYSHLKFVFHL